MGGNLWKCQVLMHLRQVVYVLHLKVFFYFLSSHLDRRFVKRKLLLSSLVWGFFF